MRNSLLIAIFILCSQSIQAQIYLEVPDSLRGQRSTLSTLPWSKVLSVEPSEQTGTIRFDIQPRDALLYVGQHRFTDSQRIKIAKGSTLVRAYTGQYPTLVMAPGYSPLTMMAVVKPGITTDVQIHLQPISGTLSVRTGLIAAMIDINKKTLSRGNLDKHALPIGSSMIRLSLPGSETVHRSEWIEPDRNYQIDQEIKWKTRGRAFLHNLAFPGFGQFYQERKKASLLFFGTGLATLSLGSYLTQPQSDAKREYKDAILAYNQATTYDEITLTRSILEDKQTQYELIRNTRNLALGSFGVVYLVSLLDGLIFMPSHSDYERRYQLSIRGDQLKWGIHLFAEL